MVEGALSILNHYCTGLLKYHPVFQKTSAIMDLFFFYPSINGILDTKNPDLNGFWRFFCNIFLIG